MPIRHFCFGVLITLVLGFGISARGEINGTGLQIAATADFAGGFGLTQNSGGPGRFQIFREGEIMAFSPADYLFDGRLTIAAENDGGIIELVLHEAILSSSRLIPRSRFRLGQFFLNVGRINSLHRHDWPFTSTPKAHGEIFEVGDMEGVSDLGFEYSYLLPIPFYLDLTLGVTSGWTFGHVHGTAGDPPQVPTHYGRLMTYFDLPGGGGAQVGTSYLGRKDFFGTPTSIFGVDAVLKWRENQRIVWLLQSELWYRKKSTVGVTASESFGGYLFAQYGLTQRAYAGVRLDYYKQLLSKDYTLGVLPQFTYQPSEFTTFRASYRVEMDFSNAVFDRTKHFVELQAVFILGSHPAHEF